MKSFIFNKRRRYLEANTRRLCIHWLIAGQEFMKLEIVVQGRLGNLNIITQRKGRVGRVAEVEVIGGRVKGRSDNRVTSCTHWIRSSCNML